jgi:hypothetical protein
MSAGCGCECDEIVLRFQNPDGTFTYPPTVGGTITVPNPNILDETTWAGVAGAGITITPGGAVGHAPTIGLDPSGVCAIVEANCPETPLNLQPGGGITIVPGGTNGHSPTISLNTAFLCDFVANNCAVTGGFSCGMLAGCSVFAFADMDNTDCEPGDILSISVDGTVVCVPGPPQVFEADANGDEWDNDNPGWVDPASAPKWAELRVTNTNTGCEIYRRVLDVLGQPQWEAITV